jgi:hypothetical protein
MYPLLGECVITRTRQWAFLYLYTGKKLYFSAVKTEITRHKNKSGKTWQFLGGARSPGL